MYNMLLCSSSITMQSTISQLFIIRDMILLISHNHCWPQVAIAREWRQDRLNRETLGALEGGPVAEMGRSQWGSMLFQVGKLAHCRSKKVATISTILHLKANISWSWWQHPPRGNCDFYMTTQFLTTTRYAATYCTCRRSSLCIGLSLEIEWSWRNCRSYIELRATWP